MGVIRSVSVVIPARNEEKFLPACLDSIQSQHIDMPVEVIVVDNNSSDKTAQIAKSKGARVVKEPNIGLHFARQSGFVHAKGELLVYIDADTRLPFGWLRTVVAYFQKYPDVVAVSCQFVFFDGKFLEEAGRRVFQKMIVPILNVIHRVTNRPDFLVGSSMAVRRDALKKIGGIDMSMPFYGEDINLSKRIHKVGKVRLIDDIFVYTSARRYYRLGTFSTFFKYALSMILLEAGLTDWARVIARKE